MILSAMLESTLLCQLDIMASFGQVDIMARYDIIEGGRVIVNKWRVIVNK